MNQRPLETGERAPTVRELRKTIKAEIEKQIAVDTKEAALRAKYLSGALRCLKDKVCSVNTTLVSIHARARGATIAFEEYFHEAEPCLRQPRWLWGVSPGDSLDEPPSRLPAVRAVQVHVKGAPESVGSGSLPNGRHRVYSAVPTSWRNVRCFP